jgi:hypothetical protein
MKPEGPWGGVGGAGSSGGQMTAERCPCGGTNIQHYQGCPIMLGKQAADRMHLELENRAREMIRALIKEATDPLVARIEELERRLDPPDTIPAPGELCATCGCSPRWCECKSHSGAVVVPRGSSRAPDLRECRACGMVACVCPHRVEAPTDGSNGEGGP